MSLIDEIIDIIDNHGSKPPANKADKFLWRDFTDSNTTRKVDAIAERAQNFNDAISFLMKYSDAGFIKDATELQQKATQSFINFQKQLALKANTTVKEQQNLLSGYLTELSDLIREQTNLSQNKAFKQLLLAERLHTIEKSRETLVTIHQQAIDNQQYQIIQIEEPINQFTDAQYQEFAAIFSNNPPEWFNLLPKLSQNFLKDKLAEQNAKPPRIIAKVEAEKVLQSLPSTIKNLPILANFSRHHLVVRDQNGNVLRYHQEYRSASAGPNGIKHDGERSRITEYNLKQVMTAHETPMLAGNPGSPPNTFAQHWELTAPQANAIRPPILFATLLSPLKIDTIPAKAIKFWENNNYELIKLKTAAANEIAQTRGLNSTILTSNNTVNSNRRGRADFATITETSKVRGNGIIYLSNAAELAKALKDNLAAKANPKHESTVQQLVALSQTLTDLRKNKLSDARTFNADALTELSASIDKFIKQSNLQSDLADNFTANGAAKAQDFILLLAATKDYIQLANAENFSFNLGRNHQLFRSALERIIVETSGSYSHITCKSGKDRTGIAVMHADAMLIYQTVYGKLPSYFDNEHDRALFVDIFAELFLTRHQQFNAAQNARGAYGLKGVKGTLPKDIKEAIDKKAREQYGIGDIFQEEPIFSSLNKPELLHPDHQEQYQLDHIDEGSVNNYLAELDELRDTHLTQGLELYDEDFADTLLEVARKRQTSGEAEKFLNEIFADINKQIQTIYDLNNTVRDHLITLENLPLTNLRNETIESVNAIIKVLVNLQSTIQTSLLDHYSASISIQQGLKHLIKTQNYRAIETKENTATLLHSIYHLPNKVLANSLLNQIQQSNYNVNLLTEPKTIPNSSTQITLLDLLRNTSIHLVPNDQFKSLLKAAELTLSEEEIQQIQTENQQIFYRKHIINPVVAEIAQKEILHAKKTHWWSRPSVISYIDDVNDAIFHPVDDATLKRRLTKLGLERVNNDELQKIQAINQQIHHNTKENLLQPPRLTEKLVDYAKRHYVKVGLGALAGAFIFTNLQVFAAVKIAISLKWILGGIFGASAATTLDNESPAYKAKLFEKSKSLFFSKNTPNQSQTPMHQQSPSQPNPILPPITPQNPPSANPPKIEVNQQLPAPTPNNPPLTDEQRHKHFDLLAPDNKTKLVNFLKDKHITHTVAQDTIQAKHSDYQLVYHHKDIQFKQLKNNQALQNATELALESILTSLQDKLQQHDKSTPLNITLTGSMAQKTIMQQIITDKFADRVVIDNALPLLATESDNTNDTLTPTNSGP
ncbi:MAG: hypothetical protein Tsb005_11190 [Gammaproteobacteria bacterium]